MGFATFLADEFDRRRGRNRRYSLRAFARDLGCDHATLSQWLRGRRTLTAESIARIAAALRLDAAQLAFCMEFEPLAARVLQAAVACPAPTTPTIAGVLDVTADRVNIVLHRLLRLGVLRMERDRWVVEAERMVA